MSEIRTIPDDYNTSLREGVLNPLSGLPFTTEGMKQWDHMKTKKFAEPDIVRGFNRTILENDISIISAGTGVGKSVLAPAHILKLYNYKANIGVTQPKTLTTQAIASYLAEGILDTQQGKYVSYQYRFNSNISKNTKITVMTDAIMKIKLVNDPELYDVVMIDEVHERNVNIDLILFLMNWYYANVDFWREYENNKDKKKYDEKDIEMIYKPKRLKNPVKFVLLSATLPYTSELIKYFNSASNAKVGLFEVEGRTFPIDNYFFNQNILKNIMPANQEYKISEYLNYTKEVIIKLLEAEQYKDGEILVFLPTKKDIIELTKFFSEKYKYLYIGSLYSGLSPEAQEIVIDKNMYKEQKLGTRKLVFSTPIAETGLTVDGVKYVVETGVTNNMSIDQFTGFRTLKVEPINMSSAIQRCGRGGRTGPGTCFHVYPEEYYKEKFGKFGSPDIYNISVKSLLMNVLEMTSNINIAVEILSKKVLDPIRKDILDANLLQLYKLNIISPADGTLTKSGKFLSMLGMDLDLAIVMMNGFFLKIPKMIAIICSMMSIKRNPKDFFRFKRKTINGKVIVDNQKIYNKYRNKYGDPVVFLNIFRFFYSNFQKKYGRYNTNEEKLRKFCNLHDLEFQTFKDLMKVIIKTEENVNLAYEKIGQKLEIPTFPKNLDKMSLDEKIILAFKRSYIQERAIYNPMEKVFYSEGKKIDKRNISPFLEKTIYENGNNKTLTLIGYTEMLLISDQYRTSCDFVINYS